MSPATGPRIETDERCRVDRHDLCPFAPKSDGRIAHSDRAGMRHSAAARCFCWCHARDLGELIERLGPAFRRLRIDTCTDTMQEG